MALEAKRLASDGAISGTIEVSEGIFGAEPRKHIVFDTLLAQLAGRRQGTAKVKGRSEVAGGGRKPYKQKGTGNARQGSLRAPNYAGGGKVFGPLPRSYEQFLTKGYRAEAIRVLLSQKNKDGQVFVAESLELKAPKTKNVTSLLKKAKLSKAIFVDVGNDHLRLATRNIPGAMYADARSLNVFDLLKFENVILAQASLKHIEDRVNS